MCGRILGLFRFLGMVSFFVLASKRLYFAAFSRKIDAFYTSPSASPASFSTSPACPSNIPTIIQSLQKLKSSGAELDDVRRSDDSNTGAIQLPV